MKIIIDSVGENSIDKAQRLLAGIPEGADKAIGRALKRAGTAGNAHTAKVIKQEYAIGSGDLKKYGKGTVRYSVSGGSSEVTITYRGTHIPLLRFDTSVGKDGRVTARVKTGSGKTAFDHAFMATMPSTGHTGIFERETSKRFPVRELLGPSVPQMIDANETVKEEIAEKIEKTFDERIDHEILAVLNGWS